MLFSAKNVRNVVCGSVFERDCFFLFFYRVFLLSNGTLLITQVKPRNTGTYRCVGRGLRGSQVTLEASLLIAGASKTYTHTKLERKQLETPVIL